MLQMKTVLVFLLLSILTTCQNVTSNHPKNIKKLMNGAELANTIATPWVVSISMRSISRTLYCAGNLVSANYVLTGRSCFFTDGDNAEGKWFWWPSKRTWNGKEGCDGKDLIVPDDIRVLATFRFNSVCRDCYDNDSIYRKARKIILPRMCEGKISEKWQERFDLAIVELFEEVPFSDRVFPVNINFAKPESHYGQQVTVAGYGSVTPDPNTAGKLRFFATNGLVMCLGFHGVELDRSKWLCARSLPHIRMICTGDSGAGAIVERAGKYEILGLFVRSDNCNSESMIAGFMTPVQRYSEAICKYTKICP